MEVALRVTAVAFAALIAAAPVVADPGGNPGRSCTTKLRGAYGFHCWGSAAPAGALEPVSFVGTVEGSAEGIYEGYGTLNSSLGSLSTHFAGPATFDQRCFGRVTYTTYEILLPGGGTIPLPPVVFDFIGVDGGQEILGAGVAPGVTGPDVPRLACRLVKIGH